MSDFDGEPRGRSATPAVIIAVIFLAILGTGVGIVLGAAKKNERDDAAAQPSPTAATSAPAASGTPKPSTTTKTPTGTKTYPATVRDKCPEQTIEAAGGSLRVKRYIKTNKSEVWICGNDSRTVYQGHTLNTPFRGATTDTSLFTTTVAYEDENLWIGVNGDTRYIVGTEQLRVEKNGDLLFTETVVDLYEG